MTILTTSPRAFTLVAVLATSVLIACSNATAGNPYPVTWYSGFTLPEHLASPYAALKKEDIRSMLSEAWADEIEVAPSSKPDEHIVLSSCAQYLAYPAGTLEPVHPMDGAPYMARALTCQAALQIIAAQPASRSHIPSRFIVEDLPQLLPPEVAMIISTEESKRLLADKSKRSWADITPIKKATVINAEHARFEDEGGSQDIELVARGDFNGDGLEDVLFTSHNAVEGGSYAAFRLFQVTRRVPEGRYELIKAYSRY